jgi:hypothetical protein
VVQETDFDPQEGGGICRTGPVGVGRLGFDVKRLSNPKVSLLSRGLILEKFPYPRFMGKAADDREWKPLCNKLLPRVMVVGRCGFDGNFNLYLLLTVE